jgi:hypothetical protein
VSFKWSNINVIGITGQGERRGEGNNNEKIFKEIIDKIIQIFMKL